MYFIQCPPQIHYSAYNAKPQTSDDDRLMNETLLVRNLSIVSNAENLFLAVNWMTKVNLCPEFRRLTCTFRNKTQIYGFLYLSKKMWWFFLYSNLKSIKPLVKKGLKKRSRLPLLSKQLSNNFLNALYTVLIPQILQHAIVPGDQQQYHHHLANGSPSAGCLEFYHVRKTNPRTPSAIYLFLPAQTTRAFVIQYFSL